MVTSWSRPGVLAHAESLYPTPGYQGLIAVAIPRPETCAFFFLLFDGCEGANVLVGVDSLVKLADFGCSKRAKELRRCAGLLVGALEGS